jgi:hypothetical protein
VVVAGEVAIAAEKSAEVAVVAGEAGAGGDAAAAEKTT